MNLKCVWNNSLVDSVKEFVSEFVKITSEPNKEGNYTFLFSRYDDYKITTEVLYSVVHQQTAFFFWCHESLLLSLDTELNVIDAKMVELEEGRSIIDKLIETPNTEYLGFYVNSMGEGFHTFTLKDEKPYQTAKDMFDNNMIDIEHLTVSEDDISDATMEFLNHTIEVFQEMVDNAIEKDENDPRLNENPLANKYYDKDEEFPEMNGQKRMLGGDESV